MKTLSVTMTRNEIRFGWAYMIAQLFILPNLIVYANARLGNPLSDAVLNFIFFALNFTCVTVILRRFFLDNLRIALATPFLCLRTAGIGLMLYYAANHVMGYLIVLLRPDFYNVNDSAISSMTQGNYTLMSIATILLVPPVEEALYRGLLFQGLYNRSRIAAYAVSTVVFSGIHVMGYIGQYDAGLLLLCFLQYVPAGLCMGWAYARADSIWAPVLMHITINQIGMYAMR